MNISINLEIKVHSYVIYYDCKLEFQLCRLNEHLFCASKKKRSSEDNIHKIIMKLPLMHFHITSCCIASLWCCLLVPDLFLFRFDFFFHITLRLPCHRVSLFFSFFFIASSLLPSHFLSASLMLTFLHFYFVFIAFSFHEAQHYGLFHDLNEFKLFMYYKHGSKCFQKFASNSMLGKK